jgi:uncharacterized membrane protein YphA (DoxX/SURF4 family)
MKIFSWILSIVVAVILLQTLYFKFSGAPEPLYIFEKIGLGDAGRFGSAIVELIASILLLIPRTRAIGAILALGTITGAIFFHLTSLGIEVMGDGGTLFYMALVVFVCSLILLVMHRAEIPVAAKMFKR